MAKKKVNEIKSYDFDAMVFQDDVYCVEHLTPRERAVAKPIFADSEWDYYPVCTECGYVHDYVNLTDEGRKHEGLDDPKKKNKKMKKTNESQITESKKVNEQETEPPTKVIFRKWKHSDDIIALFPEIPADNTGFLMQSYEHAGQHGGADPFIVYDKTTPAKPDEYDVLKAELEEIGYNLRVVQRATYADQQKRMQAVEDMRVKKATEGIVPDDKDSDETKIKKLMEEEEESKNNKESKSDEDSFDDGLFESMIGHFNK
jgi:hypothetical protein